MGRKRTDRAGKQPQQNFQDLVASATVKKFDGHIQEVVKAHLTHFPGLLQDVLQNLSNLSLTVRVLENLTKKQLKLSDKDFSELLCDEEDKALSLRKVELSEKGDTVRASLREGKELTSILYSIKDIGNEDQRDLPKASQEVLIGVRSGDERELVFKQGRRDEKIHRHH